MGLLPKEGDGLAVYPEMLPPKGRRLFNVSLAPHDHGWVALERLNHLELESPDADITRDFGLYHITTDGTSRLTHIIPAMTLAPKGVESVEDIRMRRRNGRYIGSATVVDSRGKARVGVFAADKLLTDSPRFSPIQVLDVGEAKNGYMVGDSLVGYREFSGDNEFSYASTYNRWERPIRQKFPLPPYPGFGLMGFTSGHVFIPDQDSTKNTGHTLLHFWWRNNGKITYEIVRAYGEKLRSGIINILKIDPIPVINNRIMKNKFAIDVPELDGKDVVYSVSAEPTKEGDIFGLFSVSDRRTWPMQISHERMTASYAE